MVEALEKKGVKSDSWISPLSNGGGAFVKEGP
jgi:hypothetical protein